MVNRYRIRESLALGRAADQKGIFKSGRTLECTGSIVCVSQPLQWGKSSLYRSGAGDLREGSVQL